MVLDFGPLVVKALFFTIIVSTSTVCVPSFETIFPCDTVLIKWQISFTSLEFVTHGIQIQFLALVMPTDYFSLFVGPTGFSLDALRRLCWSKIRLQEIGKFVGWSLLSSPVKSSCMYFWLHSFP